MPAHKTRTRYVLSPIEYSYERGYALCVGTHLNTECTVRFDIRQNGFNRSMRAFTISVSWFLFRR